MDEQEKPHAFNVHASPTVRGADDLRAVLASHHQMILTMSIGQAREFSMDLARAADEAEHKLTEQHPGNKT